MSDLLQLRSDRLEWREVDGEVVVLDTEASVYIAINQAGSAIWPNLAAGATRDDLVARLREEFGIDENVASTDVDAFIAALRTQGLLD